jgi:hypothetical protein
LSPALEKLKAYTLSRQHDGEYNLVHMSELYAAAGMLKYAQATLSSARSDGSAPMPTNKQWMALLEAGRRERDPAFAKEMMMAVKSRMGRPPSKKMMQVLLDTYAENAMPEEALEIYTEMAAKHGADASMKMAVLKACIRHRDIPGSFVDAVVERIDDPADTTRTGKHTPLPRRVSSMVLMAYASRRNENTVDKCMELARRLVPLRERDFLALLRACRESHDIDNGVMVLDWIDTWKEQEGVQRLELSLSTEIIMFYTAAGRIDDAVKTFNEIPTEVRDRALYNVMIDALMEYPGERGGDSSRCDEFRALGRGIFNEAWEAGLFGQRERKLSRDGRISHIDLHRLGLWTAELALSKHVEELAEQSTRRAQGAEVNAVKVIAGTGGKANPSKTRLCERVRHILYERGIQYRETNHGVFTMGLEELLRPGGRGGAREVKPGLTRNREN